MTSRDDIFQPRSLFLLKITGRVSVHFVDGSSLDGEIAAQDELSLFLARADGPVMIPRGQVKFVQGQPGQVIEADRSPLAIEPARQGPAEAAPEPAMPVEAAPAQPESTKQFEVVKPLELASPELPPIPVLAEQVQPEPSPPVEPAPPPPVEPTPPVPVNAWDEPEEEDEESSTTLVLQPEDHEPLWSAPAVEPPSYEEPQQAPPWVVSEPAAPTEIAGEGFGRSPVASPDFDEDERTFIFSPEPAEKEVAPYLLCTGGPHDGEVYKLTGGIGTMGRSPDSTYPLNRDKEVSRRHAIIGQEAGKYFIQDQNSLNGTFVNNELIKGSYYLKEGDVILVGLSTLEYHDRAA